MNRNRMLKTAIMTLMASLTIGVPALAETHKHKTVFSVRYGGIEIAEANFNFKYDDTSYVVNGSGNTSGLLNWFASGTGEFQTKGTLRENKLNPKIHTAKVREKKKTPETLTLGFTNNAVTEIKIKANKPRKKRVAPHYIPIEAKHKAAVLDPASALIVPMNGADATDGKKVCNQLFPIFDGETRYDMKLNYKTTKRVTTGGYEGFAYVCQLRFRPIAGHRKGHRTTKEMARNKKMEIWLAPMNGVSVFSPIQISVATKYGRFSAVPKYFGAMN